MGTDTDRRQTEQERSAAAEAEEVARAEAAAEVPAHGDPRRSERLMLVLLCAVIGVALLFMGWYVRKHANTLLPRALQPLAQKVGMMRKPVQLALSEPVGSPAAKVQALVVMEHCLEPVQELLVQIGTTYPDHLRAEFVNMYSPEGQKVMAAHGESCAGVYVNDRNRFQITVDGEAKDAYLHGLPGAGYRLGDIVAIIKQEIQAAYGTVPADFDQRIVVTEGPTPMAPPGAMWGAGGMGMPPMMRGQDDSATPPGAAAAPAGADGAAAGGTSGAGSD